MICKSEILWKKKVILLDYADYELERRFKIGEISKVERKIIKRKIDDLWIKIWQFYPHSNASIKKGFELNFS